MGNIHNCSWPAALEADQEVDSTLDNAAAAARATTPRSGCCYSPCRLILLHGNHQAKSATAKVAKGMPIPSAICVL